MNQNLPELPALIFLLLVACGDGATPGGGGAGGASDLVSSSPAVTASSSSGSRVFGPPYDIDLPGDAGPRTGRVRLEGNALVDDGGPFVALGATMMWAAWAYKFDRPRLEANLAYLAEHGFHYVRALGVVGDHEAPDFWDGREIDWRWDDYDAVIAGLTDLAFHEYGLRIEWTLIGDGQKNIPSHDDRVALVDRFLAMSVGREQAIMHFELANEAWQNGFAGSEGVAELRELTRYMNDRTDILVAASAPAGFACEDVLEIYEGGVADLATIHFDRDLTKTEGAWRPVRQPWEHVYCEGAPVGSNNEPIGPGASVASEDDPVKLVAAAITTYVSNLPMYVFHSDAGVRGLEDFWTVPGIDAFGRLATVVPPDLPAWTRKNAHWADAPFQVFAGEAGTLHPDTMWPDLGAPESGAVRAYGATQGDAFFVFPIGILDHVTMAARRDMELDVIDPMNGEIRAHHVLAAGERFDLAGAEALIVRGRFTD
jgi:hypothetical protein